MDIHGRRVGVLHPIARGTSRSSSDAWTTTTLARYFPTIGLLVPVNKYSILFIFGVSPGLIFGVCLLVPTFTHDREAGNKDTGTQGEENGGQLDLIVASRSDLKR